MAHHRRVFRVHARGVGAGQARPCLHTISPSCASVGSLGFARRPGLAARSPRAEKPTSPTHGHAHLGEAPIRGKGATTALRGIR